MRRRKDGVKRATDDVCGGMAEKTSLLFLFSLAMLCWPSEAFDPLAASERPKMFVDYLNGPLRGE